MCIRDRYYRPALHREAIEVHKHNNCLNREKEILRVNKFWYCYLEYNNKLRSWHRQATGLTGVEKRGRFDSSRTGRGVASIQTAQDSEATSQCLRWRQKCRVTTGVRSVVQSRIWKCSWKEGYVGGLQTQRWRNSFFSSTCYKLLTKLLPILER